jgi:CelD/BcsL family acetyltransferase involved in cellulose biosynthesis
VSGAAGHVEPLDPAAAGEDIRCNWRRLAIGRENPFLTPEWFEAWHDPASEAPWILAWRRRSGAELGAVLPLVRTHSGIIRTLRFPGADNGDWFGIASDREDEADAAGAILEELGSRSREWDVLRLDRVEAEVELHGPRPFRAPDVLPFIEFAGGGYEGWLASRSRNFRSQLGRRRRRAEAEHEVVFRDTPKRADLDAALRSLFEFHEARRRMQGGEGVLSARARAAYGRFAELSLERGWLRIHSLELDGEPVAAWYGWRVGGRYCYGISGFDPAHEELAVGTLLLAHTIQRAAEEGAEVYDLLWGDEAYKSHYETGRRTVESLAMAAGARGRVALAVETSARTAAARLPGGARGWLRRKRAGAG